MFSWTEIKRNLQGCLDVALFMPQARDRFGNSAEEALRSFVVPILLFPLTLLMIYASHGQFLSHASENTIALLYSLRLALSWALFLGSVYWLLKRVDRHKHFCQFVVASNWLSLPATIVFIPVLWMVLDGSHSWAQLYPLMACLTIYTCCFTAFMAARILRIPWELAGFISLIGLYINDNTMNIAHWVGTVLQS